MSHYKPRQTQPGAIFGSDPDLSLQHAIQNNLPDSVITLIEKNPSLLDKALNQAIACQRKAIFDSLVDRLSHEKIRVLYYSVKASDSEKTGTYFQNTLRLLHCIHKKKPEKLRYLLKKDREFSLNIKMALNYAIKYKALESFCELILSGHFNDNDIHFYFEQVVKKKLIPFIDFLYPLFLESTPLNADTRHALELAYQQKDQSNDYFRQLLTIIFRISNKQYFYKPHFFHDSGISSEGLQSGKLEIRILQNIRYGDIDAAVNILNSLKKYRIPEKEIAAFLSKIQKDLQGLKVLCIPPGTPTAKKVSFDYSLEAILKVNAFNLSSEQIDCFLKVIDKMPGFAIPREYNKTKMLQAIKFGKLANLKHEFEDLCKRQSPQEFEANLESLLEELSYIAEGNTNSTEAEIASCEEAIRLLSECNFQLLMLP